MTTQPELQPYYVDDKEIFKIVSRVFEPVCILDHEYEVEGVPDYFFIVRKWHYQNNGVYVIIQDPDEERVCLFKRNVVNVHLRGDDQPFTREISNELRNNRKIKQINNDMYEKAIQIEFRNKLYTKKQIR